MQRRYGQNRFRQNIISFQVKTNIKNYLSLLYYCTYFTWDSDSININIVICKRRIYFKNGREMQRAFKKPGFSLRSLIGLPDNSSDWLHKHQAVIRECGSRLYIFGKCRYFFWIINCFFLIPVVERRQKVKTKYT